MLKLEIKFSAISLADFINIIPNLKRAIINRPSVDQDGTKNFSKFAQDFVSELTRDLFGNQRIILPFDIHTSIFVRKMSPPNYLQILSDPHKRAIAAAMTGRSYDDMLSIKDVSEFFPAELDTYRSREILLFHPKGSFFYASPDWQKSTPEIGPEVSAKLRRKAECMRNNYVSFLVVLFAVNRFLKECPPSQHPEISNEKLDTIKNCFRKSFLTNPSEIYFKHAFQKIAPIIGLDKSLNEL